MPAIRIIDDHSELSNITSDDHHAKYTDAEAVAAADASDKFIERNVENIVTDETILRRESAGSAMTFHYPYPGFMFVLMPMNIRMESITNTFNTMMCRVNYPWVKAKGIDTEKSVGMFVFLKLRGHNESSLELQTANTSGTLGTRLKLDHEKVDVKNLPIKDLKNHPDATLSGTPKVVELLIGSTPYYFKVYPSKI